MNEKKSTFDVLDDLYGKACVIFSDIREKFGDEALGYFKKLADDMGWDNESGGIDTVEGLTKLIDEGEKKLLGNMYDIIKSKKEKV